MSREQSQLTHAASPAVSVVVVNYNSGEDLEESLPALLDSEDATFQEVILVDNASTDRSLEIARRWADRDRRIRLIASSDNRGYAGGANLALPRARGRYIAILNPDVMVSAGWLSRVVAVLEQHPEAAAANPLILLYGDEGRVNAAGQDVHITGLGFNRLLGRGRHRAGTEPARVAGVQGGALVVRRELLAAMNGWDDSGFLYHEDVEISWLLQLMGYELYCVPAATVRHKYHLSMYPEKLYLLERNRLAMLCTHVRLPARLAILPFVVLTELMMWAYCALRGPRFLRSKLASYASVLRRRAQLSRRRDEVETLRRRSDWQLLRRLRWSYDWSQFLTLGRERGPSSRQPAGGPPATD